MDSSKPATHLELITHILVRTGDPAAFADKFGPSQEVVFNFVATDTITAGVPEASAWATLLLGFGSVGFVAYLNRPKASRMTATKLP